MYIHDGAAQDNGLAVPTKCGGNLGKKARHEYLEIENEIEIDIGGAVLSTANDAAKRVRWRVVVLECELGPGWHPVARIGFERAIKTWRSIIQKTRTGAS